MILTQFRSVGSPALTPSLFSRCLFVLLLTLLTLIALPQSTFASPHAVTITVTTTDDELNQDGDCSLREAVQAANTDAPVDACPSGSNHDIILLSSGTYSLTLASQDADSAATGDLDILGATDIIGMDAESTIIDANGIDRAIQIHEQASVLLAKLTLRGGQARSTEQGGGILNLGELVAQEIRLLDNQAGSGNATLRNGGAGGGLANLGTARLRDATIASNRTGNGYAPAAEGPESSGNGGDAGGVFNSGSLTLMDSIVRENRSGAPGCYSQVRYFCSRWGEGGGILNSGFLTMTGTLVSANTAVYAGGGLLNRGSAWISHSTFSDNSAPGMEGEYATDKLGSGDGGGILNSGSLTIMLSNIVNNRAGDSGSSVYGSAPNGGQGGGINNSGVAIVDRSLISGNRSGNGAAVIPGDAGLDGFSDGGHGGGIFSRGALTVTQSTITGNSAGNGGFSSYDNTVYGSGGSGGGIYANSAHIRFTTIVSNTSGTETVTGTPGQGGGIFSEDIITLTGVVFSANISPGQNPSCAGSNVTSLGYNLIEDSQGCVLTGTQTATSTDILDQPALLGPLADSGGPTLTHEPVAASPAVDAVPWAACLGPDGVPLSTDQRGAARSQGAGCDMGAVERIMWVAVGSNVGATLVYTDTDGKLSTFVVPAGAFPIPTQFTYRPATHNLSPGFGWAASNKVFDLVAVPVNPGQNAQNRSDLRLLSPIQIRIEYSDSLFHDTPIIRDSPLTLMIRNQESWQPSAATCATPNMAISGATSGELQASTCEIGHFLVAGATHSVALPLTFNNFVPN